jgi:signal transduction histidine kinase
VSTNSNDLDGLQRVVSDLISLSQLEDGAKRHERDVPLLASMKEVCRQLREVAHKAQVRVYIHEGIPDMTVPGAVVELCLSNFVANAIKYHDPQKSERFAGMLARIAEASDGAGKEVQLEVYDNGLGMPKESRANLFKRFFRAHETVTGLEGKWTGAFDRSGDR